MVGIVPITVAILLLITVTLFGSRDMANWLLFHVPEVLVFAVALPLLVWSIRALRNPAPLPSTIDGDTDGTNGPTGPNPSIYSGL